MSYLLDTNVLSELRRPAPDPNVLAWADARPAQTLYLSVLTLGELRKGVELLPGGPRRFALADWLDTELSVFFAGRILAVDRAVADRWGRLLSLHGRPAAAIDSLLAATALAHDLRMVTRNVRDFDFPGLEVIDPWQAAPD